MHRAICTGKDRISIANRLLFLYWRLLFLFIFIFFPIEEVSLTDQGAVVDFVDRTTESGYVDAFEFR